MHEAKHGSTKPNRATHPNPKTLTLTLTLIRTSTASRVSFAV